MTSNDQISVQRGKTINWCNTSGMPLALTITASDGTKISFNIPHGQSARVIAGGADVVVDIHPCDEGLVGIREGD